MNITQQNQTNSSLIHRLMDQFSIETKLKLIIMVVSSVGIILAGLTLLFIQRSEIKNSMVSDLSTLAKITSENSKSAISFQDTLDATEVLSSLEKKASIELAILYDSEGVIFATFQHDISKTKNINIPTFSGTKNYQFTDRFLEIRQPVLLNEQIIGELYLRSNLNSLDSAMNRLIYLIVITLIILEVIGFLLASYMQHVISFPIISLATLARKISTSKDYSLRAEKFAKDELGDLADDFNNMLEQVRQREIALKESEQRFQTLLEQAVDALLLIDSSGNINHVNPSACNDLGYSQEELLSMKINQIDLGLGDIKYFSKIWNTLNVGESRTEYRDYSKSTGKTYPVEVHLGKFELGSEVLVLAFARDITQRKLAEETLKRSNDQLEEQVEKRTEQLSQINRELISAKENAEAASKAKTDFLANMSHEIRTPMNAVMGFTELLGESDLDFKQRSYVGSIQSGARGLMTIINDILDLSKIEAGKLSLEYESIDTYSFIFEIEKIFSQAITDKNLDFEIVVEKELPKALVIDQTRVRQILFNLIGNAIKFTDSGHIIIRVKHSEKANGMNNELSGESKIDILFSIEDTGIGIEENQISSIFGQFEQQKGQSNAKFGGTGLGLTICKNLAEMMNGEITVESTLGVGSIFTLQLTDISIASLSSKSGTEVRTEQVIFEPAKIMLVDDIKTNRRLIMEQFKNSSFEFSQAENGLEAVRIADQVLPDLIIMDIRMPVMDGIEATKRIKNNPRTSDVPVIALTASVAKTDDNLVISQQFDALLHKPIRKFEIVEKLKSLLKYRTVDPWLVSDKHPIDYLPEASENNKRLLVNLKELQQSYQIALDSGLMSDISEFSQLLISTSKKTESDSVTLYAEKLYRATELFDIDEIEYLLPKFLTMVKKLEDANIR